MEENIKKYYIRRNLFSIDLYEVDREETDFKSLYINLNEDDLKKKVYELRNQGIQVDVYHPEIYRKRIRYVKSNI